VLSATATAQQSATIPENLPTVGYDVFLNLEKDEGAQHDLDVSLNALENEAHAQHILLSSDAMRYFVSAVPSMSERSELLNGIAKKAKALYPSEEGWVVLNLTRMEALLEDSNSAKDAAMVIDTPAQSLEESVSFTPMKASSLAEAIVTKNITAAYALMSNRPMVALADAASDLNTVYLERKGQKGEVSDLLRAYTRELSTATLEELTLALTSALDGTYHTEEEAVKMAILKAVQVLKRD
jgi:hypothetical protein